jgi:hypothetical protein
MDFLAPFDVHNVLFRADHKRATLRPPGSLDSCRHKLAPYDKATEKTTAKRAAARAHIAQPDNLMSSTTTRKKPKVVPPRSAQGHSLASEAMYQTIQ